MVKKKRTALRSTKAAKRRPAAKRKRKAKPIKQNNAAPVVTNFDPTPYEIAADQRKLSAAVRATSGEVTPPPADVGISTTPPEVVLQGSGGMKADPFVRPAPIPITPTVYPDAPDGPVIVHNHITINIQSAEFSRFDKNLEALIGELHRSNEISGEVRDQLVSELWAGREIIGAPKPQRDLIDLLLVGPLKWLIEKSGSAMVSKLAGDALEWLIKMLH